VTEEPVYMGFFTKKIVCHFHSTIPVVWSSLDHSKDGSNKNFVIRRLRRFDFFFIWFLMLLSHNGMIFVISITCVYSQINIQEESCIQIDSFLSDGIVVEPRVFLLNTSLNAMYFNLKEFDLIISITAVVP